MKSWIGDVSKPVVSINCLTYNHENYIEDTLEGFLIQKTNFPFEVLIHDDASMDKTAEIIREYESSYPNIIKPIYQIENQWSKDKEVIRKAQYGRVKGKYIALCEGDDYWTDPYKLKKQVDFLTRNPDCSLCFHASKLVYTNNLEKYYILRPKKVPADKKFKMKHAILGGGGFMATSSMVFVQEHVNHRLEWMDKAPVGDLPLMLLLATKGKIGYIDKVMCVYKIMTADSWSSSVQGMEKRKKHHFAILKMWDEFDEWTQYKYHHTVERKKLKNKLGYFKGQLKRILK